MTDQTPPTGPSEDESGQASGRKRLGRGLAALIGDLDSVAPSVARADETVTTPSSGSPLRIPIDRLGPNPNNPRREFAETDLSDLANSIREHGVMQPLLVRKDPGGAPGRFEIIAGERRWRASQRVGLHEVPVIVRDATDKSSLELAIVENVQRADLNAVEEALGYHRLMTDHDYTQNDLGQVIGKSRSHVANTLRLLKLPPDVLELVANGSLSAGHARTLVTAEDPGLLARKIVAEGLSVRQAEKLAQANDDDRSARPSASRSSGETGDADVRALEKLLEGKLGLVTRINAKPNGSGRLEIRYKSLEQLDGILRMLQADG
ncbi:MAG: ParB/RepB/Spo0J family partition protein [Pseudomonadota bacterium]